MERLLLRVPVVATVYTAVKQVIDSVKSFNTTTVLRESSMSSIPSTGCRLIGFVTGQFYDEVLGREMTAVVIPTAPSPMTGLVVVVESDRVIETGLGSGRSDETHRFSRPGCTEAQRGRDSPRVAGSTRSAWWKGCKARRIPSRWDDYRGFSRSITVTCVCAEPCSHTNAHSLWSQTARGCPLAYGTERISGARFAESSRARIRQWRMTYFSSLVAKYFSSNAQISGT